jgi:hypothetical protein
LFFGRLQQQWWCAVAHHLYNISQVARGGGS